MAAETGFNEYTRFIASPKSSGYPYIDEWGGRRRMRRFSGTQGTDFTGTSGNTAPLVQMRKGERLLDSFICFEAGGAAATFQIGVTGTTGKYSSAIDVSAAGNANFLNTVALNYGEVLTADEIIIGTFAGANFAAGKKIAGHINYVID